MTDKEVFQEGLRIFASHILAGLGNDFNKANEAINGITGILNENPKLISFVANEKNREQFKKIKIPKDFDPVALWNLKKQFNELYKEYKKS